MDDLWGNAWGSPDDVQNDRKPVVWSTSEKTRSDDPQEDDLSMPSWSTTGPGIRWDEPSTTLSPLWSAGHHVTQQDYNPYGNISLGNSSQSDLPNDDSPDDVESHPTLPTAQSDDIPASPPSAEPELEEEVISSQVLSSVPAPGPSPQPSPNAFGTFIAGAEHGDVVPFPSDKGPLGSQLYATDWDSPWGSVPEAVDDESPQHTDDEWESAKLRQLEMDSRVPPELLSRILLHLEDFAKDAWPGTPDEAEPDWQRRWHSGMDVDGFDALMLRYVPSLTLPQVPPFGRSFTAKAMADSVKLSRNTALARTSPMSTFLAAKGSTAWEASVKSRIEMSLDEVPLGWRILDKEGKKDEKVEEIVRKPTGLLAGLWGRRTSSATNSIPGTEQSTSPLSSVAPESIHSVQTPNQRSSIESVNSSGTKPVSLTLLEPYSPSAIAPSQDGDLPPSSASSAVSRFLNRFSRSRASYSPSRNSLTLSGDDLEYLSDVRSNSTEPVDTSDDRLEFGSTAPSGFLHGKLPPLLPPPLSSPSLSLPNPTTSPLGPFVGDDKTIIISPVIPNPAVPLDAQKPTEQSSVFALTPLIPSSIQANSSKSIRLNSDFSISSSSDKINPSLYATLLPTSSRGAVQTGVLHDDDDDFSDFLSSPADPPLLTFSASPPSSQGRVPPSHGLSMSLDDDFANLMSLSTGGLPDSSKRPDAALTPNPAGPALRAPAKSTSSIARRRKGSREEEHLYTLGLVERAAARPGRWPAPPSPLPEILTPPPPPEFAPSNSTDLDILDIGPTHARSNHQRHPSTSKATTSTSSPSKAAVQKGHQRTQSLLDLAAARPGRWPAPPSPFHEALPPPPPPARNQGAVGLNVDYFGTTPTEQSFTLPPPPVSKTSPPPSLSNTLSLQMTLGRDSSPSIIQSSSLPLHPSAPPTGLLSRRTLSPPPLPTAVISKVPSKLPKAPIPLLPPPSGYRLTPPPSNPPSRQYSPESTPLALLVDSGREKLPAAKATPPPPVKGTGGLTAQDLSFFEGL